MRPEEWDYLWNEEITGMILTSCDIKITVGELPKISFMVCMNLLVEKLSDESFEKLKSLIDRETKYRKKS